MAQRMHWSITSAAWHDSAGATGTALIYHTSYVVSLNSCCMGAPIKKHAIFVGYTLTSDMIPPYHIA